MFPLSSICYLLEEIVILTSLPISGGEYLKVARFRQGGVVCLERDQEGYRGIERMVEPGIIR